MKSLPRFLTALATLAFTAATASAALYEVGDTLTLSATSVSPAKIVKISTPTLGTPSVYAGVTHLNIQGIGNVDALCIDPFQWATRQSTSYKVANLGDAPLSHPMGLSDATLIGKLWSLYFDTAKGDANTAAGLQIAVWMIVGAGNGFSLVSNNDFGAAAMITAAGQSNVKAANLVALTSATKQDFVVRQVPDGGTTVLLLGLGLTGLAALRRRSQVA